MDGPVALLGDAAHAMYPRDLMARASNRARHWVPVLEFGVNPDALADIMPNCVADLALFYATVMQGHLVYLIW